MFVCPEADGGRRHTLVPVMSGQHPLSKKRCRDEDGEGWDRQRKKQEAAAATTIAEPELSSSRPSSSPPPPPPPPPPEPGILCSASTGMTMAAANALLEAWKTTEKHTPYDNMHDILQVVADAPELLGGVNLGEVMVRTLPGAADARAPADAIAPLPARTHAPHVAPSLAGRGRGAGGAQDEGADTVRGVPGGEKGLLR